MSIVKDKQGVKLQYPNRTCKECTKYPCIPKIEICRCNFAAYGCINYNDNSSKIISE